MNAYSIAFAGLLITGGGTDAKPTREGAVQVLNNVRTALEAKDFDKALAIWKFPPGEAVKAADLKKAAEQFAKLGWFAKDRTDLLTRKGKWSTYEAAIDKAPETLDWGNWEVGSIPRNFKVSSAACYVLVLKDEVGAVFHWDGKRFTLLAYQDQAFEERKFIDHCLMEIETGGDSAKSLGFGILANMGPKAKSAAPRLAKLLKHKDSWIKVQAAFVLWKVDNSEEGMPVLLEALTDQKVHPITRVLAADGLGAFGPKAKKAVPALTDALKEQGPKLAMLRVNAAWALWKVDRQEKAARAGLIGGLKDRNDVNAFTTALRAFEDISLDREAIAVLREAFKVNDGRNTYRDNAVRPLVLALKENDVELRKAAVATLILIGPNVGEYPTAVAALKGLLKDADPELRKTAAEALKKIEAKPKPAPEKLIP